MGLIGLTINGILLVAFLVVCLLIIMEFCNIISLVKRIVIERELIKPKTEKERKG